MSAYNWIWQHPDWPQFNWDSDALAPTLRACVLEQGRLLGLTGANGVSAEVQQSLDALLQNILTSSAIEGEQLNAESVRSSLARRLGLEKGGRINPRSEGLAELMMDATAGHEQPLTLERLLNWHRWLFPEPENSLGAARIKVGSLRGEEVMHVVSGRLDKPRVHFEAPPRAGLARQLHRFLQWFAASQGDRTLDPLLRAGLAHFWFVTLHPFDDGNGRLARAITDLAMAQAEHQAIRCYAMATSILEDRRGYYDILESSQRGTLDLTRWLHWFLQTLLDSLQQAVRRIERVLAKTRFWQQHAALDLAPEQVKVLNRLLDGRSAEGKPGFENGISAAQYQAVAKVSKATATRHLADLLRKGCLLRLPGGGRSTRYQIDY